MIKKLILILLLTISCNVQAEISTDKKQHFAMGGVVYASARGFGYNELQSFGWAFAAGMAKEVYDSQAGGVSDTKDVLATALGALPLMTFEWKF
jgi:hypothetical protein